MKISVRTAANKNSAVDLFNELLATEGDQLLISSGFISNPGLLPCKDIVSSVSSVVFASGHWNNLEKHDLASVIANARTFALTVQREARAQNKSAPKVIFYTDAQWHAKVALKRRSDKETIAAAIIGSSNLSISALSKTTGWPNQEVDILITEEDGPDAKAQLVHLFKALGSSFEGKKVVLEPPSHATDKLKSLSEADQAAELPGQRAAQATLALCSPFFSKDKHAIDFDPDGFYFKDLPVDVAKNDLETTLRYAEVALGSMAAILMKEQAAKLKGAEPRIPAFVYAHDLSLADRALAIWNMPLLREELLSSARAKLCKHASVWRDITAFVASRVLTQPSMSLSEIEALPSVQNMMAARLCCIN